MALVLGIVATGLASAPVVWAQEADTTTTAVETDEVIETDTEEAFTPPLFGAPERRVGAGSRDLGARRPAECEPDAESGECPGDD